MGNPKTTGSGSGLSGFPRSGPNAAKRALQRLAGTPQIASGNAIYVNPGGKVDLQLDATASGIFSNLSTGLAFAVETANKVLAGPTTGAAAAPTFRSLVTADLPAGTGTVTSVGLTTPGFLVVAGSPVTTSGTLAVTLATQNATTFLAGPTSGAAATPTFRSIANGDLQGNTSAYLRAFTLTSVVIAGNTIANTAAATQFSTNYVLPGNVMQAGTTIKFKISGTYGATGTPAIDLVILFAGQGILTTTAFTTAIPGAVEAWYAEAEIICFTPGATGKVNAQGRWIFWTSLTTNQMIASPVSTTFTIDTTANQTLAIQVQWSAGAPANTITLLEFIVDIAT